MMEAYLEKVKALESALEREKKKNSILEIQIEKKVLEIYESSEKNRIQKEHLEQIINNMREALFILDKDYKIRKVNIAAEKLLKTSLKSVIGSFLPDYFLLSEEIKDILSKRACPRKDQDYLLCLDKNRRIPVMFSFSKLSALEGEEVDIVILMRDLTARKEFERQLLNQQKLESLGALSSGVAHEINTPMQCILDNTEFLELAYEKINNYIDKILSKANLDQDFLEKIDESLNFQYIKDEVPKALNQMLNATSAASKIVKSLKAFAHPDKGKPEELDMNKLIKDVTLLTKGQWKHIAHLNLELEASLPKVECIPGELHQVFINLIVNAVHAIEERQDNVSLGQINIKSQQINHEEVQFTVKDNGAGIPKKIKEKVFDPFFTTKEVGKGTGQGLAITYKIIVSKHAGKIEPVSEPGNTQFKITLPIKYKNHA